MSEMYAVVFFVQNMQKGAVLPKQVVSAAPESSDDESSENEVFIVHFWPSVLLAHVKKISHL